MAPTRILVAGIGNIFFGDDAFALRSQPLGESAAVIGEVVDEHPGFVMMKTRVAVHVWWICSPANNCPGFASTLRTRQVTFNPS